MSSREMDIWFRRPNGQMGELEKKRTYKLVRDIPEVRSVTSELNQTARANVTSSEALEIYTMHTVRSFALTACCHSIRIPAPRAFLHVQDLARSLSGCVDDAADLCSARKFTERCYHISHGLIDDLFNLFVSSDANRSQCAW